MQTKHARITSWNLLVQSVMLIQKWLHISCFEMTLILGKATQECWFKHCPTADYRCTNVWQTTLWEAQKARVFPSPLMVIMNFVFMSASFDPCGGAFLLLVWCWRTRERLCLYQLNLCWACIKCCLDKVSITGLIAVRLVQQAQLWLSVYQ